MGRKGLRMPTDPAVSYEEFLVPYAFSPWARDLAAHAAPQPGERVLDVACGTGVVLQTVAPTVGPHGRLAGVDLSPAMLAVARSKPFGEIPVEWHEASADELPFPDNTFDLVLCQQGLQFFPDKAKAIGEMRRVLRYGGRVALSVWRSLEHNPIYDAMNEAVRQHLGVPAFAGAFSGDRAEIETLLSRSGFDEIVIAPVTMMLRFPSVERYVKLSLLSAAAVLSVFQELGEEGRAAMVETVQRSLAETLRPYTHGNEIHVPMAAYVATARAG